MQKVALAALVVLTACGGGSETPKADSAAVAPAALTVNDLTGTFAGTTTLEGSDSVVGSWTSHVVVGPGGGAEGHFVNAATPADTVSFTQTIEGDSVISQSAPYTDPQLPKETGQVRWRAVGRANGMQWSGTVVIMPAGADTVLQRMRWTATRTP